MLDFLECLKRLGKPLNSVTIHSVWGQEYVPPKSANEPMDFLVKAMRNSKLPDLWVELGVCDEGGLNQVVRKAQDRIHHAAGPLIGPDCPDGLFRQWVRHFKLCSLSACNSLLIRR